MRLVALAAVLPVQTVDEMVLSPPHEKRPLDPTDFAKRVLHPRVSFLGSSSSILLFLPRPCVLKPFHPPSACTSYSIRVAFRRSSPCGRLVFGREGANPALPGSGVFGLVPSARW